MAFPRLLSIKLELAKPNSLKIKALPRETSIICQSEVANFPPKIAYGGRGGVRSPAPPSPRACKKVLSGKCSVSNVKHTRNCGIMEAKIQGVKASKKSIYPLYLMKTD